MLAALHQEPDDSFVMTVLVGRSAVEKSYQKKRPEPLHQPVRIFLGDPVSGPRYAEFAHMF